MNGDVPGWIDVPPAAIALEPGETFGQIADGFEAERNDDSTCAIDEAASIVLGYVEESVWQNRWQRVMRPPGLHASYVTRRARGDQSAFGRDLATGAAAVVDALIGTSAFAKIGGAPSEQTAGPLSP